MNINNTCYSAIRQNNTINSDHKNNTISKNPSFGSAALANPLVGFANFIETNGFLGEFLTVDTTGMAAPRAIQGYNRNKKELGHLNYKAGAEETIREALSGPAFFFVPAIVLGVAAAIKGRSAKVSTGTLDIFKGIMKKASKDITDLKETKKVKKEFLNSFVDEAFGSYKNKREEISKIKDIFAKVSDGKITRKERKQAIKQAEDSLEILNKANGKNIDDTSIFSMGKKVVKGKEKDITLDIKDMIKDIPNYLDDFTNKAKKATSTEGFIDSFHKQAEKVRRVTNILAVSSLAAFLLIIPSLYQKDKKYPGLDGLDTKGVKNQRLTSIRIGGKKHEN